MAAAGAALEAAERAAARGRASGGEVVAARETLERVQGEAAAAFAAEVHDARAAFRAAVSAAQTRFDRVT